MPSTRSRARQLKWRCSALAIVTVLAVAPARAQFASAVDLASLNGVTGFRLDGIDALDLSGYSSKSAGDVNGDGFGDLVIGARFANSSAGETYVVFGKSSGSFASVIDLASLNGMTGFRLDGIDADDRSGRSAASAGDVNGDGFGDIVVGAYGGDPDGDSFAGESYVVFGRPPGGFASAIGLASLNGLTGFRLNGIDGSDNSGFSVAAAGDVNGDGFSDLIIGDPNGDSYAGETYVVFGRASGFASAIDLGGLNGTTGFRLGGIDAQDYSGLFAAAAGDVNGDGFGDLVIGATGADPNGDSTAGESYVIFGRAPIVAVSRTGSAVGQYISGGVHADTLLGLGGNDTLEGRALGDVLNGGPGSDAASYRHANNGVVADLSNPAANTGHAAGDSYVAVENLVGSSFNDALRGNAGANVLTGGKGRDALTGAGGPTSSGSKDSPTARRARGATGSTTSTRARTRRESIASMSRPSTPKPDRATRLSVSSARRHSP